MSEDHAMQQSNQSPTNKSGLYTASEKRIKQNTMYEDDYQQLMSLVQEQIDLELSADSTKIETKGVQECVVERVIKELNRLGYAIDRGYGGSIHGAYLVISWW